MTGPTLAVAETVYYDGRNPSIGGPLTVAECHCWRCEPEGSTRYRKTVKVTNRGGETWHVKPFELITPDRYFGRDGVA